MLKAHQNEVSQANANNDAIIDNVNEQGAKLVDNSNDFAEGMQAQAEDNVVNYTNTMERQTLDQTSWQVAIEPQMMPLMRHIIAWLIPYKVELVMLLVNTVQELSQKKQH